MSSVLGTPKQNSSRPGLQIDFSQLESLLEQNALFLNGELQEMVVDMLFPIVCSFVDCENRYTNSFKISRVHATYRS